MATRRVRVRVFQIVIRAYLISEVSENSGSHLSRIELWHVDCHERRGETKIEIDARSILTAKVCAKVAQVKWDGFRKHTEASFELSPTPGHREFVDDLGGQFGLDPVRN